MSSEATQHNPANARGHRVERASFWLARHTKTVFFFTIVLGLAGIYLALRVPISVFPETDFPRVVIGIDNGVMPVEQMQVLITKPIEDAVNSVPGLITVRSTTSRGSAEVSLFFSWNEDMVTTLQLVDAALSKVEQTLPSTAQVTTHRLTFATFPILGYSLTSDTVAPDRLWEIATYDLKPPLNRLPGVSTVIVQGGKVPEYLVTPNSAKLLLAGITITDLVNSIDATNLLESPGLYEADHQLVLGLVGAQVHSADELGQIVVKNSPAGVPVKIADVADVHPGVQPVYTIVRANGKPAVLINIARQPSSNTVEVADEVAVEVERLKVNLPAGVRLEPFYDQSQLVRDSITSVRDAILIGIILASIIIVVFLRDWRSSLIAGLVIPITVLVTIVFLKLTNQSFNLMTLGGLAAAVGLVIDDAIVVVENIVLHRDSGEGRIEAVCKALQEITTPLVFSTITPIVVFLPLISVTGVTGTFFRALAITMTVSLLASLALALTWTPALSLLILRGHNPETDTAAPVTEAAEPELLRLMHHEEQELSGFMRKVLNLYERWFTRALNHRLYLLLACLLLVVGTVVGYRSLGSDLLPGMDEGGFVLDYIMPAGSSLTETDRVLQHVEAILRDNPNVEIISRRTGLQMGLAAVTEANSGDITVKLKAKRSQDIDDIMSDLRAEIKSKEPALDIEFVQVLEDMINDLSNSPEPIQIKLFNNDPALLAQVGDEVATVIKKQKGVVDVLNGIENTVSGPSTTFRVNPSIASRLGFTAQEITTDASAIVEGVPVQNRIIQNGRPYTIRIRFADDHRASFDAIQNTVLNSSTGKSATLGSVATLEHTAGEQEIRRENLQRNIAVTGRLEGTDLGSGIQRVQAAVAALHIPPSVRVQYGGTYEEQQKSFAELARAFVLALALVFGVLLAEFRNLSAPISILTSSILSISGVVFALLVIPGITFNVASFMGLIMVIGIVAKNGILLLDAYQKFRDIGMDPQRAMILAGRRRLRPILMTALAAIAGMLPLAFALGAGSQMLQPLAIAVIGGLVISMLLSLVVTPVMYLLMQGGAAAKAEES